jgi:hypothetical protein
MIIFVIFPMKFFVTKKYKMKGTDIYNFFEKIKIGRLRQKNPKGGQYPETCVIFPVVPPHHNCFWLAAAI